MTIPEKEDIQLGDDLETFCTYERGKRRIFACFEGLESGTEVALMAQ